MIKARRIRHVSFSTPDLARQADYFHSIVGLGVVAREPDRLFMATESDELAIVLEAGTEQKCKRIAFEVAPDADLAGMRKAEVETVKAFASRTVDRARPAYGRLLKKQSRHSIDVGTTNSSEYLQSQTGNRRFWPMRLLRPVDLDKVKRRIIEARHFVEQGQNDHRQQLAKCNRHHQPPQCRPQPPVS
jgi:catechol 2,3-dioxygenase-like lactoylglutathione lyase family enzyme